MNRRRPSGPSFRFSRPSPVSGLSAATAFEYTESFNTIEGALLPLDARRGVAFLRRMDTRAEMTGPNERIELESLPIAERWDCHCTGDCCRGTLVALTAADRQRLAEQRWGELPEFRGQKIVWRHGLFRPTYSLAKRRDGSCVFLQPDGLCRIHVELGEAAKPRVCRMFPMQIVEGYGRRWVALRRYCPSAATEKGRCVAEHLPAVESLLADDPEWPQAEPPPRLIPGAPADWLALELAAAAVRRLLTDDRFPPVRRLVHLAVWADQLRRCRLRRVAADDLPELLKMLEQIAVGDGRIDSWFRRREPAGRAGRLLFRQALLEHLRLSPENLVPPSLLERWRLIVAAWAFARGRGPVPPLGGKAASVTFEQLEEPLGALSPELLRPLGRFFEAAAWSQQYCLCARRSWSLVESVSALALALPVAMWIVRWRSAGRSPALPDLLEAVGVIDRAMSCPWLCGPRHRRRCASLLRLGELPRLLVWYAR